MKTMTALLKIEFLKLRRRHLGLLLTAASLFQGLWMYFNTTQIRMEDLSNGFCYLLMMDGMLETLLFPLLLAMTASRIADIEHKGSTLKLLYTLERPSMLFDTKLLLGLIAVLFLTAVQAVLIVGIGILQGFWGFLPLDLLLYSLCTTFVLSCVIFLIQLLLSLFIENQLVPLLIGLFGSFTGIFSLYLPQASRFFLWGFYGLLAPAAMDWNPETRITAFYPTTPNVPALAALAILGAALGILGHGLFSRKEV